MAEEKGFVTEDAEAVLRVELSDGSSIDCILDTGFNGNLILPKSFVEKFTSVISLRVQIELAEGKTAEVGMTPIDIKWLGDEFSINILVSDTDESLIGTEMLIDSVVEIDYKNLTVKITK